MASREIPIQFAFEQILGQSRVFGEPRKETKPPFLLLSQSKLEQLAYFLENPDTNPATLTHEKQALTTAGIGLHDSCQTISTWLSCLPPNSHHLKQDYHTNLLHLVAAANPTAPPQKITSIYRLLNDERFILPNSRHESLNAAKHTVYHLIADKLIDQALSKPPFTTTPLLDPNQFEELSNSDPDPVRMREIWNQKQYSELIHQRVDNLFKYHQGQVYNPSKIARQSPGDYGQEVRASLMIPHLGIIWSTRFDEIYFTKSQDGTRNIYITDFKLGHAKFEPKDSLAREMQRLSLFMTALVAQHLPEKLPITGKAIQLTYRAPVLDSKVNITYLGFKDSPNKIDFEKYYGHDWESEGCARNQLHILAEKTAYIQSHRQELAPIFDR